MNNFTFQNPTKLLFGKGMIENLPQQISKDKRIMVTFGGGSVKKNGVYDQVIKALDGFDFIEFWGIEPNPTVETLRKAITLGKEKNIDFLLAVGGGSVVDGTKLIAAGILYDGDAWEIVKKGNEQNTIPLGAVLTLPATGSEMNAGAVISCITTKEKFAFGSKNPVFSILDPETTFTLPGYQIACGIADTFVHTMEQYMTTTGQSPLMDRWAEGILSTLIEITPKVIQNKTDYEQMANFMLSATMGLNGFIAMGVTQDWATHMIGHELTAMHGITHGETLAIVLPGTLRVLKEQKKAKLIQYGERVWGITKNTGTESENAGNGYTSSVGIGSVETINSDNELAERAIEKTEEFFRSLSLATRLTEKNIGEETILEVQRRFNARNVAFGENGNVTGDVAAQILRAAL